MSVQWLDSLSAFFTNDSVITTVLLIIVVLVIQTIAVMALRRNREVLSDTRRRWISAVQNVSIVVVLVGLLLIWSPQLSTLALSLAAFTVGIVIALKELILCFVGAIHRASTRPFEIGDWIEIGGKRGEVTEEGMLSFRLLELGAGANAQTYTGRMLVIPNSRLLVEPVINESFRKRYLHHTFTIALEPGQRVSELTTFVAARIRHHLGEQMDIGARYHAMVRQRTQVDVPGIEPVIRVGTTDLAKIILSVTVFCATKNAGDIESRITQEILDHAADLKEERETLLKLGQTRGPEDD